jgi:hypothetical protein
MVENEELDCGDSERLRLFQHPEVFLLRCGRPEIETRFAKVFRQTWDMIPCNATQQITAYWKPDPRYFPERVVIQKPGNGKIDDVTPAITLRSGHRIEFHREAVTHCPQGPLIGLIVHELAHVYGHAIGDRRHKAE